MLQASYAISAVDGKTGERRWLYVPSSKGVDYERSSAKYRMLGGAAGGAKALAVGTEIPTPQGLRTMGELAAGDRVFDDRGVPCTVVATTAPVIDPTGTYRLVFDDGAVVVAGGGHEWHTFTSREREQMLKRSVAHRARRRAARASRGTGERPWMAARNQAMALGYESAPVTGAIRTTEEIARSVFVRDGSRVNHAVRLAAPWQMDEAALPLDPYVLGVWLGDGDARAGYVTSVDPEVLYELEAAGWPSRRSTQPHRWSVPGLRRVLKAMGLLAAKAIPPVYLTASAAQRLALLQGLMDTDGSCGRHGKASFTNTNRGLADGVVRLAASLGVKPHWREGRARLYGRDCGPVYHVSWTASLACFRLPRKADRLKTTTRATQGYRYIVACERIADMPVQCIEVDSPSHLYLCTSRGIPTHNSHALRWGMLRRAQTIEGYEGLMLRRTYGELEKSQLRRLARDVPLLGGVYHESKYLAEFPQTGALIEAGHLDDKVALSRWLSTEYDEICADEGSTFDPAHLLELSTRARSSKPSVIAAGGARFSVGTNPGGPAWPTLKDFFVTHTPDFEQFPQLRTKYRPEQWAYVKALLDDNPYRDADYEDGLAVLGEARYRQLRWGDEDVFEGQFFSEWREHMDGQPYHVQRLEVPSGCEGFCSLDWGFNDPFVCYWWVCLPDGRYYLRREWKDDHVYAEDFAKQFWVITREEVGWTRPRYLVVGGDTKTHHGIRSPHGETVQETLRNFGLPVRDADRDRINGWYRIHELLRPSSIPGSPWLIVDPSCTYLRRTLPNAPCDPDDLDEIDEKTFRQVHGLESLRYGAMSRPSPTRIVRDEAPGPGTWGWWERWHAEQSRPGVLA